MSDSCPNCTRLRLEVHLRDELLAQISQDLKALKEKVLKVILEEEVQDELTVEGSNLRHPSQPRPDDP